MIGAEAAVAALLVLLHGMNADFAAPDPLSVLLQPGIDKALQSPEHGRGGRRLLPGIRLPVLQRQRQNIRLLHRLPVHMPNALLVRIDETVHPQRPQPVPRQLFRVLSRHIGQNRVVDVVIQHARRHNFLLRVSVSEIRQHDIEIGGQLQLQPLVYLIQIKCRLPGLIVNDPDIDALRILAEIHPVNASLQPKPGAHKVKALLQLPGAEIAPAQLLRQREQRGFGNVSELSDEVAVPGAVIQQLFPAFRRGLLHRLPAKSPKLCLIVFPKLPLLRCREAKGLFDGGMIEGAQIEGLNLIALPLREPQPVLQEMGKGTAVEELQPGDGAADELAVERLRRLQCQPAFGIAGKCRRQQLPGLLPPLRCLIQKPEKVHLLRFLLLLLLRSRLPGRKLLEKQRHCPGKLPQQLLLGIDFPPRILKLPHRKPRQNGPELIEETGGLQRLAGPPLQWIAQHQPLRGVQQRTVNVEASHQRVLHPVRCQFDVRLPEEVPLPVSQQLLSRIRLGKKRGIGAGQEEALRRKEAGAGHVADDHLIDGRGNHPHTGLLNARIQHLPEFTPGNGQGAQELREAVQHLVEHGDALPQGLRPILLPFFLQPGSHGADLFLGAELAQKLPQGLHPRGHRGIPCFCGFIHREQRRHPLKPQGLVLLPGLLVGRNAPQPLLPQVIVKKIDFVFLRRRVLRQRPEEAQHRIEAEALVHRLQCRPHHLRKGRIQEASRIVKEIGNACLGKGFEDEVPVVGGRRQENADVLIAEALLPHRLLDLCGDGLDFAFLIRRLPDFHVADRRSRIEDIVRKGTAVKLLLDNAQCRGLPEARQRGRRIAGCTGDCIIAIQIDLRQHGHLQLRRHGTELLHGLAGEVKQGLRTAFLIDLLPLVLPEAEGELQRVGLRQKLLQHAKLYRGEAGEAVKEKRRAVKNMGIRQGLVEPVQKLLLRHEAVALHIGKKGLVDHGQILQLALHIGGIAPFRHQPQHLRQNPVLVELGNLGLQLIQEARLVQLTLVETELRTELSQHLPEDHDFSEIVDDSWQCNAFFLKNPVGHALKAHDVDVQDAVPPVLRMGQDPPLHGQGVLLRHHQNPLLLKIPRSLPEHLPQHIFGFSGARTAEDKLNGHDSYLCVG